jgi:type I restriction enzyme S subunit
MPSTPLKLSDVAEIIMGQSPAGEDCNREGLGLPLLNGPTEFGPSHPQPTQFTTDPKKRALAGDLLFCVRGSTTGRMNWADQEYAIGRGIAAVRHKLKPKLQPLVRAVIEQNLPALLQAATGSTFPNVSGPQLAGIPFPNFNPTEAVAIASILGTLDDKIELNRQINETLEAMARAIFKDWFVDFGPTRAKIEGRAPYLAPDIWSLFPERLDATGKPEGWIFGTLGDIAQQVGETVEPEALDPETPYIGLEHMPRRLIALSEWEGANKVTSAKLIFRKGDFLFGKLRPYFHKVGIAPLDGICSTDIVVLNAREPNAAAFVLACISQDEFVAFTDRTSDGTKMPRTSWGRMERYGLCLPSRSALEAFKSCVEPMLDRIVSNIHESRALAATRDLLLPKLLSGEVRVKDAEKLVEGGT